MNGRVGVYRRVLGSFRALYCTINPVKYSNVLVERRSKEVRIGNSCGESEGIENNRDSNRDTIFDNRGEAYGQFLFEVCSLAQKSSKSSLVCSSAILSQERTIAGDDGIIDLCIAPELYSTYYSREKRVLSCFSQSRETWSLFTLLVV